jgi:curved DNA-binding protein CbpA
MAQCECGRPLGVPGKLCARCDALRTLGLERGASRNEIHDTYRDLVKVWHPDRFSYDGKLRGRAEEKLKEVNAAFQHLNSSLQNSSGDATPASAASRTKNPEAKTAAQKPYWTSKTAARNYQWYSASARETRRWNANAAAQEPPRKDVSAPDFRNAADPRANGSARKQSPIPEPGRAIFAASQRLNSSAETTPADGASATRNSEETAEAQKPYGTFRISQLSSAVARKTARLNASAQGLPWKNGSASGFPDAARPESNGVARTQFPTLKANHRVSNGGASNGTSGASFSLRGIPALVVLALFVAFTQMWVNVHKPPAAAQDEILNQYYEAEAGKNAAGRLTAQDEIMNFYYEAEARKNVRSQLESAPTEAEGFVVALLTSPSVPKRDVHLRLRRSSSTDVSDPLRSDAGIPVSGFIGPGNHVPCSERGGRLDHRGDCRTR